MNNVDWALSVVCHVVDNRLRARFEGLGFQGLESVTSSTIAFERGFRVYGLGFEGRVV